MICESKLMKKLQESMWHHRRHKEMSLIMNIKGKFLKETVGVF
jgi:hypothetical protein